MRRAIPPHPNTPSWGGVQLKAQGQLYLYLFMKPFGETEETMDLSKTDLRPENRTRNLPNTEH